MIQQELLLRGEATYMLLRHFDQDVCTAGLEPQIEQHDEIVINVVTRFAIDVASAASNPSEGLHYLSSWHRDLRADCSSDYALLRADNPNMNKSQLNQDKDLWLLNGVRRGVHKAMIEKHKSIEQSRGRR